MVNYLTILVLLLSNYGWSQECQERSLLPYLSAKVCLPAGATVKETFPVKVACDDYRLVGIEILLPGLCEIELQELARCNGEKGLVQKKKEHLESLLYESNIEESTENYVVQKVSDTIFIIHFFKEHSGWPYYMRTTHLKNMDEVKRVLGFLETFSFM